MSHNDTVSKIDETINHLCDRIITANTADSTSIAKMTSALAELVSARADLKARF